MTTKPKARKFRIRRSGTGPGSARPDTRAPLGAIGTAPSAPPAAPAARPMGGQVDTPAQVQAETDLDTIRAEGLTGRQLRMARRVAQKHGIAATSDFDAVRQLRARGIDPFEKSSILELVKPTAAAGGGGQPPSNPTNTAEPASAGGQPLGRIQLPQTVPQQSREVGHPVQPNPADQRAREILKIQRDIAKRRRRRLVLLASRLSMFVMLPTLIAGYYFFAIATPLFATKSEFVIQQAEGASAAAGGLGGLFQGTSMATQQDSTAVQSYLTSRDAMQRLDTEHGFKAHFSDPSIDAIQRLPQDASNEETFAAYQDHIRIAYDPSEGVIKMEVSATDPTVSQRFSEALIGYAEEQVDQMTQRLREDQMAGAEQSYRDAETRREQALQELLRIQNEVSVLSPEGEVSAILAQVSTLETQKQQKQLELAQLSSVRRPNEARVNALTQEIANLDDLIIALRSQMTQQSGEGSTLASKTTELRLAEENYQFQTLMVQQALTMRETARIEAERQVRYLSLSVRPIAPDDPTYPRALENTLVTFLIFAGIYLMISLTASILREQVSS
ncbi:capsule biosynthesis protein [Loktanella sp. IMCC34160]|uniref:capsule biosynthesis protein n=1 Tax=Loktanella sp. IMCC34160 TaxID=2510646 RepID=UPI00101E0B24|nr:capsule biosynthesis protein [Loktanella sp. IMCC34160]RYG90404.1 capsule biosynthesis protein [Loktanella sp. IMCC34160]